MGAELIVWLIFFGGWVAGWILLWNIPHCHDPTGWQRPPVSVIIPARDEERNLPELLASLQRQIPPPEEILVVDDGSTDRTAEIARNMGARTVESAPLPDGWRGKAWACHQGAEVAHHDLLLFLDADTRIENGGLAAALHRHSQRGGAVSAAAFQHIVQPYEQLQATFVWVMTAASGAFTPARKTTGLFGPFLLVSKAEYRRAGGHAAVRGQVLENLAMADCFRRAGIPVDCFGGRGTVSIRMYPDGFAAMCRGWRKAFATGAGRTPSGRMATIILWLSSAAAVAIMTVISVFSWPNSLLWAALYLAYVRQAACQFRRLGTFSRWTAILYPVPLFFFFILFALSAAQKNTVWKGRTFSARPSAGTDHAHTPEERG